MRRSSFALIVAMPLAFAGGVVSEVAAQAPLYSGLGGEQDFGTECLHRNDDETSPEIDLTPAFPAGLKFFQDEPYTTVYVNTNGNITFGGGVRQYTPDPFPLDRTIGGGDPRPMIAPFWADVDTRQVPDTTGCDTEPGPGDDGGPVCSGGENSVWWFLEPNRLVVTWHQVGYFSCHNDLRMNFQLILTGVPSCGGGATDFDVEFRFNRCEWETGDASGGTDGFGGTEAQAGFDAGNGEDFVAIMGTREPGISRKLCDDSNVGDPGVWRFQIRSGTVICPEAGEACDTGMDGVCGEGITQCFGTGTICKSVIPATDETCDALDNDCDGMVDEGGDLCSSETAVCDRGTCIDVCFEGGCPSGQICGDDGVCVDEGCTDIDCPEGQRCSLGECINACSVVRVGTGPDGANEIVPVRCPDGETCRGGRCFDLCVDVECDPECTVCLEGECIGRCDLEGAPDCPAGETCTDEGLCRPTECVGVTCPEGQACRDGSGCTDVCIGTICPGSDICMEGKCRPPMSMPEEDAGVEEDAGTGDEDAGVDEGPTDRGDDGCCTVAPGAGRGPAGLLAILGLLGLIVMRRRQR